MKVSDYGKVWNYFDSAVRELFPPGSIVEIEEKVDGSQFSCKVDQDGELHMRSKGAEVFAGNAGMFDRAAEQSESMRPRLAQGWEYRFEYLSKPKHNTILYGRVPRGNLVLYDASSPDSSFVDHDTLVDIADQIGVDVVPLLYSGTMPSSDELKAMLDTDSFLGNAKIEGVVIKARGLRHLQDGKVLKAKVVSDWFRERHDKDWKKANPGADDIVYEIGTALRTEARFNKAVQALREQGDLTDSAADIGPLLKILGTDLHAEQSEWVRDQLFKHFWPKIQRSANIGFPDWYKKKLADEAVS